MFHVRLRLWRLVHAVPHVIAASARGNEVGCRMPATVALGNEVLSCAAD
jgi:hypothetical protein